MKTFGGLFALLLLFACAQEQKLAGKREPILGNALGLEVDSELAAQPLSLARGAVNINWQQFMGNANHGAVNPRVSFAEKKPIWRKKIGSGNGGDLFIPASPVIFAETLYWMDQKFRVSAHDLSRRAQRLWRVSMPVPRGDKDSSGGGLAVTAEFLIVTTGTGRIYGLKRSDGSLVWQRNIRYPVQSAPAIVDNEMFFTTINNNSFALNISNGAEIWRHEDIETRSGFIGSVTPAITADIVVTGYSTGEIVALERASGKVIWKQSLVEGSRIDALSQVTDVINGFAIDEGRIFVGSASGLFAALDLRTGQIVWSLPLTVSSSVAVREEYLFVSNEQAVLFAIAKSDGKVYWTRQLQNWVEGEENFDRVLWNGPLLAAPYLLLSSSEKQVQLFNVQNGEEVKRYKFGSGFYSPPISAEGIVYLVDGKGRLYALQ